MGVEVVQHQADLDCISIHRRKLLTKPRELLLGSSLIHLGEPASGQWLDRCKQHTRTQFLVLVVLFGDLAFASGSRQQGVANQETGSLIETHHRIVRVIRLGVQPQNVFQVCQKSRVDLANTPGLFQMRLEVVFLSTSRTKV